jgi:heptaprenyl diphosphate synthase
LRAADPLLPDDLEEVGARTRAGLDQVEEALATAVASADPFVHEAASHLLAAGGKRFRPTLVLLAGHFGDPSDPRLIDVAVAIARLVEGQIRESRGPHPGQDPVDHYLSVLADKTGSLIAAACRLGAMLAGAPPDAVQALTTYGERIGVAFQLRDDLLDVSTEPSVTGKAPGTDLLAGVRTLPVLYLLRRGGPEAAELSRFLDGERDQRALDRILDLVRGSPAFEEARQAAKAEAERAKDALAGLEEGRARQALDEVADRVLDRRA